MALIHHIARSVGMPKIIGIVTGKSHLAVILAGDQVVCQSKHYCLVGNSFARRTRDTICKPVQRFFGGIGLVADDRRGAFCIFVQSQRPNAVACAIFRLFGPVDNVGGGAAIHLAGNHKGGGGRIFVGAGGI